MLEIYEQRNHYSQQSNKFSNPKGAGGDKQAQTATTSSSAAERISTKVQTFSSNPSNSNTLANSPEPPHDSEEEKKEQQIMI